MKAFAHTVSRFPASNQKLTSGYIITTSAHASTRAVISYVVSSCRWFPVTRRAKFPVVNALAKIRLICASDGGPVFRLRPLRFPCGCPNSEASRASAAGSTGGMGAVRPLGGVSGSYGTATDVSTDPLFIAIWATI